MSDTLSIRTTHESCGLCGQALEAERADCESQEIALFGAAKYAWCPYCLREVRRPWSAAYRKRWEEALAAQIRARQQEPPLDGFTKVGPALRNAHGTRCHFRLLLADQQYLLTLYIAESVVNIGTFADLTAAMQARHEFEDRLCGSGFWRCGE